MAIVLNIAKSYAKGYIEELENSQYFQLHKNATTRTELLCFAIAVCEMEGKESTAIQTVGPVTSFVRAEFLTNCEPLLSSLYYDKCLKYAPEKIDEICNRDAVYELAEKYANTGFGIIKNWTESIDEDTLFYKLIAYMDKKYEEIKDELNGIV